MPRTIQNTLSQDTARLTEALALDVSGARIEVQSLLQQVLNVSRAYLLAHPERCLNDSEQARYEKLLRRRLAGEPVAYILGEREFFGLMFKVTPATLIPRPETELLVELALQRIPSPPAPLPLAGEGGRQAGRGYVFSVLDLGTGSGAIALSIAHARPDVEVVAVDASSEALAVARENAQRLGINNAVFVQSDWHAALDAQRFDLIVSNPPYVAAGDPHLQHGDLRFEPSSALASGDDGLDDIRRIVTHTKAYLSPEGWLLLEHGYNQATQVRELMQQAGFNEIFSACDLAGIERVSGGRA
jgi:release factor glutamine methyltransferase